MSLDAALVKQILQARQVIAQGVNGGFELDMVDLAGSRAPLRAAYANGKPRIWPNLSKLAGELAACGIHAFEVRPTFYTPALIRKPRPDRKAAMEATATVGARVRRSA